MTERLPVCPPLAAGIVCQETAGNVRQQVDTGRGAAQMTLYSVVLSRMLRSPQTDAYTLTMNKLNWIKLGLITIIEI